MRQDRLHLSARPFSRTAAGIGGALYLLIGSTLAVTSALLDARLRTPTGLTQTFTTNGLVRVEETAPNVDLAVLEAHRYLPRRYFNIHWQGIWYLRQAQLLDVYAGADDRIAVEIDGAVILVRDSLDRTRNGIKRIRLVAGPHRLVVDYEQRGGDYAVNLQVAAPGGKPRRLDPESLFPSPPSERQVEVNHRLYRIRQLVRAVWFGPPLALLAWISVPVLARQGRTAIASWVRRNRMNWGRYRSGGPAGQDIVVREPAASTYRRVSTRVLYAATFAVFLVAIWRFHDPLTGFTSLIGFGDMFAARALTTVRETPHHVYGFPGSDGQFYAQLALEPLLRNPELKRALDSPPYRARRILFPWMAYAAGMGRPSWVLQAYALLAAASWIVLGIVLMRWLPPTDLRHWLVWCACLFGYGSVDSVRFGFPDGPSTVLIAAGIAALETGHSYLSAGVMGLAGLGRETNLVGALALFAAAGRDNRLGRTVVVLLLVVCPLLLWLLYVHSAVEPRVWFEGGIRNTSMPFQELATKVNVTIDEFQDLWWDEPAQLSAMALVSAIVQALFLVWRGEWHRPWWRVGAAYALFMTTFGAAVWEGHPGAYVRVLLPMTVAYNVLLPRNRWFWPLLVAGNLTVVQGIGTLWAGVG